MEVACQQVTDFSEFTRGGMFKCHKRGFYYVLGQLIPVKCDFEERDTPEDRCVFCNIRGYFARCTNREAQLESLIQDRLENI